MRIPVTERRLILIGLSLGLVVLVVLVMYTLDRKREQAEQREIVREIRNVVELIQSFQSYLLDAESGQRGFLLTHDLHYLAPYHVAVDKLPSVMAQLEQKTSQDASRKRHLETLRLLTQKKMAEFRTTLDMAQTRSTETIDFVRSNAGKILMDDIKLNLMAMLDRESELLRSAEGQEKQAADEALRIIIWVTALALLLLVVGTYRLVRDTTTGELADRLTEQTQLLDLAPIMTRDMNGRILSWSKGYERLYGWTKEEAVGTISHDLLKSRFTQPPEEVQATLLRDNQWTGELIHTRHDGTAITVSANWTLLKQKNRNPTAVVEVTTDISELHQTKRALAEQSAFTRCILDSLDLQLVVIDARGVILRVNEPWTRFARQNLGPYHPELLGVGTNYLEVIRRAAAANSEVRQTLDGIEAVLDGKVDLFEQEYSYHALPQQRWFRISVSPLKTAESGAVITQLDVTTRKLAEEAQAFIAAIVTDSLDAIITKSVDGTILTWNRGAEKLFGYSAEEIVGQSVDQLVPEKLREEEQNVRHRTLSGTNVEQLETQRLHKAGRQIDVSISMSAVRDKAGVIMATAQVIRDISIRKRAEIALLASERFGRALFQSSPDCVKILSPNGELLDMNTQGMCAMEIEEIQGLKGKHWTQLWPVEAREMIQQALDKCRTGESVSFREFCPTAKGSPRWWDVAVTLVQDGSGRILAVSRDITEHERIQKAIKISEKRFRTLTTQIPQLVWSSRSDGAFDYLSEQWLSYTGTTLEQNVGCGWLSLIHQDDAPAVDRTWKESVASGSPFITEYRLRAADGAYYWQLARATPQQDNAGETYAWFGTTTDISAQKATEASLERVNSLLESKSEALAAANKELEAFSYSVSHDLRAPLRTMTGFAQALLEDYGEKLEPEASRYLTIISNGARQMGRLIDDLLSFSRLSRQNLAVGSISLTELVQEIREELAAEQTGRTIEWDVADLPLCRGDQTTVKLVLANLLGNALKYSRLRDIATIQVGWQVDEQQTRFYRIFVKDNGVGFDMRYADKLFTVFQRLHRAEEFEGTGVGLAIVQRIVHRHGGRVWADARPNEGATFWFTLERAS
ncbi:MAG: PAS domain S-box protein [Nitrospira sp.]|nr:PAS domain S-box protein [Nitrospira sp.]